LKSTIDSAFENARKKGRRALIGYMTAGYPSPKHTTRLCKALIDGGVDILELGIPFSDPIADGPTIQAADVRALNEGTNPNTCLEIARALRKETQVPIVFLTYYNPILSFGTRKFMNEASRCADGLVVPDLPEVESKEFSEYKRSANAQGLSTILLAAPTTTEKKLGMLLRETNGFLYLVSLTGVTGARKNVAKVNLDFIKQVCRRAKGSARVAVGFGISKPGHVRTIIRAGADGVIVGSAFVNIVANNLNDVKSASSELSRFTRRLREATIVA
jgi:tryptophan synthase alpha chain